MRQFVAWTRANAIELGQNVVATAALGAIAYGFYLAYEPLGWIIPGLLVFGVLVVVRWRENR